MKLIRDIMTRKALCVSPQTAVADAISLMNRRQVSCLVVSEEGRPLGMFTVRDIVHLAQAGRTPGRPEISNWMGKPALCVSADTGIDEAYERLKSHHMRHLVVTDTQGGVAGVVSRTDIVNHLEPEYFAELKDISSVMHRNLVTLKENDCVQAAVEKMAASSISCIVIEKQGRPAGILSEKDVARLFEEGGELSAVTLAEVMSRPVLTVGVTASLLDAVHLMHERKFRRLVAVDKDGRIAGLITQSSIIAVMEDHYVESLRHVIRLREQAIQQHLADTKTLSSVVERLHQAGCNRDIHAIAMDGAMQVLHADRTGIYIFDADGVIRCKACRGLSECYTSVVEGHSPWPEKDTDAGPVFMADVSQAELPDDLRAAVLDEGIRATAFLPLRGESRLFGKLMVYYDQPHEFSADESQLGCVLAENIATAMQRLQEQESLQASRNESRQRADEWQHTFEAVDDAILLVDGAGRILRANGAAAKLCGGESPLVGQYCYEALHHRDSPQGNCAHCVVRLQGKPSSREMYEDRCGSWRVLSAYPLNANADGTYNAVIVTRDISEQKSMELALRESRDLHAEAQRIAHVGHWALDLVKNELAWSEEVYRIFEMAPEQFTDTYEAFLETVHPDDRAFVEKAYSDSVKNRNPCDIVHRIRIPGGSVKWVSERCETFYDDAGQPLRSVGTVQDITRRRQAEDALRESEERYRRLVDTIPDAIVVHCEGRIVYANPAAAHIFAASDAGGLIGRKIMEFVHPDSRQVVVQRMKNVLRRDQPAPLIEEKVIRLDGMAIDAEVTALPTLHQGKPAIQVVVRDIRERKLAEMRLERMAYHDTLTELPNRMLLFDRLGQALAQARRRKQAVAVLYIDLDDFKCVNDIQGHHAGDELLRQVADRLQGCIREVDTVARMGGDEFTCILPEIGDTQSAALVAEKMLAALSSAFDLSGAETRIGGSLGIAIYPDHGVDEDAMISHADAAMYAAKRGGKNQYRFYQ